MRPPLSFLLLAAALTNTSRSSRPPTGPELPPQVFDAWREDVREIFRFARRPDRIESPIERSRERSRLYPRHFLAIKTYEMLAYALHSQQRLYEATQAFVLAKRLALAAGDLQTAAVADNALSNIYLVAGNIGGALEAARQAVDRAPDSTPTEGIVTFQIQYARMLARSGRFGEAVRMFTNAIEIAEQKGLHSQRADAWKLVGWELALRGELDAAERAVGESIRIRYLRGDPDLASDYHDLAEIRLRAGRPADALLLLDLADRRIATARRFAGWRLDLLRGRARLALADPRRALDDLRQAIRGIDASPTYMLPGDTMRSQTTRPTEAHEYFALAALSEFDRTGDRRLLHEAFAVSEAGRAAALRLASTTSALPRALSHRYWNIVADLDEANARLLLKDDDGARRRISQLRLTLAEVETGFDQGAPLAATRLDQPPPLHLLHEDEALVTFQLGERLSLAWSLAAGRLEVARLPPRAAIQRQIDDWLNAAPGAEKEARAHELNRTLVGKLPLAVHAAKSWLVAADGELFQVPLAALVNAFKSSRPVYLAELYALQLIPGAWALERRQAALRVGRFLGVGDPIYNDADPRRGFHFNWKSRGDDGLELSRLAGSAAEIENCARLWPSSGLLTGARAVPEEFSRELGNSPVAIHLAIHVVPAPDVPSENLMVLGGGPNGRPAYLGPEWIGAHRLPGSLVVMNGCRSGSGAVSAGEGLMGLTRAWLRAGAGRVLSTYWPTLDDGGALASEFYRQFTREGVSTAEALRRAQMAMIAQTDWRADPRYWAAYFLIGYPE